MLFFLRVIFIKNLILDHVKRVFNVNVQLVREPAQREEQIANAIFEYIEFFMYDRFPLYLRFVSEVF